MLIMSPELRNYFNRFWDQGVGMRGLLGTLWKEEEGQDLTEYGLLLVLIALAVVAAMGKLASAISHVFTNASTTLS